MAVLVEGGLFKMLASPGLLKAPRASYVSIGAALSRRDVASAALAGQDLRLRQTCRGACDDLRFDAEAVELVEARDPAGRCLVCRSGWWRAYLPKAGLAAELQPRPLARAR
jgi:hypothetical protein